MLAAASNGRWHMRPDVSGLQRLVPWPRGLQLHLHRWKQGKLIQIPFVLIPPWGITCTCDLNVCCLSLLSLCSMRFLFGLTNHHHPSMLSECSASWGTGAVMDHTSDVANPTAHQKRCATETSCSGTPFVPSCLMLQLCAVEQGTISLANRNNS